MMNEAERTMGDIKGLINPNIIASWSGILIKISLGNYLLPIDKDLQGLDRRELELCFKAQYGH